MKIKVIDLLNKIANGEEVPEKIKIKNIIYEYSGYMYCTENANYQDIEDYLFGKWNFKILNEDVEIIEEPKKIEKIDFGTLNTQKEKNRAMKDTINKLIDEINNLKEND